MTEFIKHKINEVKNARKEINVEGYDKIKSKALVNYYMSGGM